MCTLSWSEFLQDAAALLEISERIGDNWILYKKNENEGNTCLIYKQKIQNHAIATKETTYTSDVDDNVPHTSADQNATQALVSHDMLQVEYHIVYSISYQVPMLYFQAHTSAGKLVQLEDSWRIFCAYNSENMPKTRADMLSILTQMEHPVLFKPFLALHPCRTAELLQQAGGSRNRVLTFISLMGPYVQLQLSNAYGLEYSEKAQCL